MVQLLETVIFLCAAYDAVAGDDDDDDDGFDDDHDDYDELPKSVVYSFGLFKIQIDIN